MTEMTRRMLYSWSNFGLICWEFVTPEGTSCFGVNGTKLRISCHVHEWRIVNPDYNWSNTSQVKGRYHPFSSATSFYNGRVIEVNYTDYSIESIKIKSAQNFETTTWVKSKDPPHPILFLKPKWYSLVDH